MQSVVLSGCLRRARAVLCWIKILIPAMLPLLSPTQPGDGRQKLERTETAGGAASLVETGAAPPEEGERSRGWKYDTPRDARERSRDSAGGLVGEPARDKESQGARCTPHEPGTDVRSFGSRCLGSLLGAGRHVGRWDAKLIR